MVTELPNDSAPPLGILLTPLPGPGRKKEPKLYQYRITYRNPSATDTGCVMTWEVTGGRMPYQMALERTDNGLLCWYCTCADMVYGSGKDVRHRCKHIQGLLRCSPHVASSATPQARSL